MLRASTLIVLFGAMPILSTSQPADRIIPFRSDQRVIATYYFNRHIKGETLSLAITDRLEDGTAVAVRIGGHEMKLRIAKA